MFYIIIIIELILQTLGRRTPSGCPYPELDSMQFTARSESRYSPKKSDRERIEQMIEYYTI